MISVVVPVSSDLRISLLVKSLLIAGLEKYPDKVRVIISLNRPTVGVREIALELESKYFPFIKTIFTENVGIAFAKNNAILSFANTTDYFVFIDADCTVHPDYLAKLLQYVEEKPVSMRGYVNFLARPGSYLSRLNCNLRNFTNKQIKIHFTPNLLLHKSIFKIVGIYDTRMKYGDDLEFDQRIKFNNILNIFNADLIVDHHDDQFFFKKTLKTWWGYGSDRGFRITRSIRMNPCRLFEKIKLIAGVRKYWSVNRSDDILFAIFYLLVTRLSTVISMIKYSSQKDIYFRECPTTKGFKLLT